jgi:NAD(P)H-hydrate repair Nnr-like enzyme with NAD(P)H-hydrate epimerase domain
VAQERFLDDSTARRVRVLAGSGGNGGGAMVAARRLHGSAAVPITSPS